MTITIAGIAFDRHHYDKRVDVLYLNVGAPEISCADDEVETLAVERIRSGATQHTQDGAIVMAELGFAHLLRGESMGPKRGVPSYTC